MELLDQLGQFMVKMHSYWFVIVDIILYIKQELHIFLFIFRPVYISKLTKRRSYMLLK